MRRSFGESPRRYEFADKAGVEPTKCTFGVLAVGPLSTERLSMASHRPIRDKTAALEAGLAGLLRRRGYSVLGVHPRTVKVDQTQLAKIARIVVADLKHSPLN